MPESKSPDPIETKEKHSRKKHFCPNCKEIWDCNYDETCRMPYEMLDLKCDNDEVRARLGGEWLE